MAFTCGFFNSVAHDRKYDAVQHGMIFDGIITDGIYATYLKAMVVKASENASEVIVQPGRAWFNHTWSYNDSDYPVAAPEPEVVLDRIDTLVLDVNSEDAVRNNQFLWVQGTPTSQTPEPPTLIHTATHNQYPLCDVYRQAGTTMIYAADITNRVGTSDCPFVTGVLESIDIDDLLAQWDDEFHTWENATKASFEGWMLNQQQVYTAWFNALKTQMAGDVADVEAWVQTIKDIIDEETATHLQLEIDEINSMLPSGSHITVTTSDTELYSRTVTITDEDNNTVTSQFDANGVAVFKSVPYVGNLTITSTDGVRTATEVVNTPYFARYEFTLAFWSATVNIIGDSTLGGNTVTITDSTTALVGTVVLNASGIGVFNATYPDTYKFSVTHGGETMEVSLAVTQETTYNVEIHGGFNYKAWLTAGGVDPSGYASLSAVFANVKTTRRLMLKHASVDYLATEVGKKLATIDDFVANDTAMKWIGLSDYACDKLTAISGVEAKFLASARWERYLKDHVPVMTSNTAPYGEVSATNTYSGYYPYSAFNGSVSNNGWLPADNTAGRRIVYKFTNPIRAKKAKVYLYHAGGTLTKTLTGKIVGSNDGTTWKTLSSAVQATSDHKWYDIPCSTSDADAYYLYIGYEITSGNASELNGIKLQFYGRSLSVSVPTLTANTAQIVSNGQYGDDYSGDAYQHPQYRAFDNNNDSYWMSRQGPGDRYIGYNFEKPVLLQKVIMYKAYGNAQNTLEVKGSNDGGNTWESIKSFTGSTNGWVYLDVTPSKAYKQYIISAYITNSSGTYYALYTFSLQFYGKDYSEKEFEVGTTKKWLYDHGVKLQTLTNAIFGSGSSVVDNDDNIELTGGSTSSLAGKFANVNLTSYSLLRGKISNVLVTSVVLSIGSALTSANTCFDGGYSEYNTANGNLPNNLSIDVSAFNQAKYVGGYVGNNGKADLTELWLE